MSDQLNMHTMLNEAPKFTQQATASGITRTSMNISATATDDGIGDQLTYIFYWGTSSSNLKQVNTNTSTPATFTVNGLNMNTTYYFRIDVTDGYTTTTGTVGNATTVANSAPVIGTPTVSRVSESTDKLTISVSATDSDGDSLTYTFLRGTSSNNITTVCGTASGSSGGTVSITDTGLGMAQTYYYKVTVNDGYTNVTSTDYGTERTYCEGSICSEYGTA